MVLDDSLNDRTSDNSNIKVFQRAASPPKNHTNNAIMRAVFPPAQQETERKIMRRKGMLCPNLMYVVAAALLLTTGTPCLSAAPPGNSIEFEFTGTVLFLGFDVDNPLESKLRFAIDDAKAHPLKFNGNRPPIATGLSAGKHRVRVEIASDAPAGKQDKVRVWGVGGAGVR